MAGLLQPLSGCNDEIKKEYGARATQKKREKMKSKKMLTIGLLLVALAAIVVIAAPFNAPEKVETFCQVTAGADIHAGWLVSIWTNGLAYGAADTAGQVVLGRAESSVKAGSKLLVKGGIFKYENKGVFAAKDLGTLAYMWTNTTYTAVGTAATADSDIKAGTIVDIDTAGVWIDTRRQ